MLGMTGSSAAISSGSADVQLLRRAPGDASVHDSKRKNVRVSAGSKGRKVQGSERERGQQHGTTVFFVYLGLSSTATSSSKLAAAAPPSWRCTGEWRVRWRAREGSGAVCGANGARGGFIKPAAGAR